VALSKEVRNRRLWLPDWKREEAFCAGGILVLAAFLRFWRLGSAPGWEWDEPPYTNIAMHVLHGHLEIKESLLTSHQPYLFHPPFYFELLAGWFRVVGSGIAEARALIAASSLVLLGVSYLLLRRKVGVFALIPIGLLAVDGWFVFSNRIGWFDNVMLVIGAVGILVYDHALATGKVSQFAIAGVLVGSAIVFKHIGAYLILAIAIHWALTRQHSRHHLLLISCALAVIVMYVAGMLAIFGGDFASQSGVQLRRALGISPSGPSISGPHEVYPLLHQYRLFYGTIGLSIAGFCLFAWRVAVMVSRRSTAYVREVGFAFSWLAAALVFFAALQIRFPQYFMMVLVPLYVYLGTEAYAWLKQGGRERRLAVGICALLVVSLHLATFYERIASRHDNALRQAASYAEKTIPRKDIVLTEEPIGTLIPQPYCQTWQVARCEGRARWLILYRTALFHPPNEERLDRLMAQGRRVAFFKGFKETISVFKLRR
jgi:4-amino-4-deoxy-L-arabinose transferase-like glycosyltransferase